MRRKLDAALKVQVVLEAIRGKKTIIPPKSWTTPLVWFTSDSGWHIIKQREEER